MSGHSKFANIKHKKEKNDAAKGKIFTIIGREIAVAVKEGGPDPANNFKLATVIAKAKANNMPNDTIERGIKKASGASHTKDTAPEEQPSSLRRLQITRTELLLTLRQLFQRVTETLELPAVYHICLTTRVRSLSIRKSAACLQMIS